MTSSGNANADLNSRNLSAPENPSETTSQAVGYEAMLAREFHRSPYNTVPTARAVWTEKMALIGRLEVRAYCHLFRSEEPEEWETVAGVLQLATADPDRFDDADIRAAYRNIANDYKVWTIEGSPYLDWVNDAEFAEAFCERWNSGELF